MRAAGLSSVVGWMQANWPSRELRRERRDNRQAIVVLAAALRPDSSCVDVGAHTGDFLRHMLRLAPAGQHVAFEPVPAFYELLVQEFPDVDVRNVALSDEAGTTEFNYFPDLPGLSGFRRTEAAQDGKPVRLEVSCERLDDALDADYVPKLIKIDVEGAEHKVLRGASELLRRHRPLLLLEHGRQSLAYGDTSEEVFEVLASSGLRVFDLDGSGPYATGGFVRLARSGERWNWLVY
jgi:FkbM family methyltransferase